MVAGLPLPLLLGGVAVAIGIAAITLLLLIDQRAATLRDARAQLRDMSLALADQADRTLESVMLLQSSLLDRVTAEPLRSPADFVARMSSQAVHDDLNNRVQNLPVLQALVAIDADGLRVNTSREWPTTPLTSADRDYFRALRDDRDLREFISQPLQNRGTGSFVIFMARRVSDLGGDFAGLILASIDLSYFERLYSSLSHDSRAYSLSRQDGVLLARSPPMPGFVGQRLPPLTRLGEADFRGDGRTTTFAAMGTIDARPILLGVSRLQQFPLQVTASISQAEVLAPWRRQALYLGAAALALEYFILSAGLALRRELRLNRERALVLERSVLAEAGLARLRHLGDVTTGMAHELNQPLASISMAAENAMRSLNRPGATPERALAKLALIVAMAQRTTGIIETMRVFGRIGAQPRGPVPMALLLERLQQQEAKAMEAAQATLLLRLQDGTPTALTIEDPLLQTLRSLVKNASEAYLRRGGAAPRTVTISVAPRGAQVEIIVQDMAGGIPPDVLPRIFMPFYTTKDVGEGSGLGLSVCFGIITELGGTITAESDGEESRFTILLPAAEIPAAMAWREPVRLPESP
jgi:C4-dicarboxylate-specific signal transduction histidine kinase